jgi:hypothetical protein
LSGSDGRYNFPGKRELNCHFQGIPFHENMLLNKSEKIQKSLKSLKWKKLPGNKKSYFLGVPGKILTGNPGKETLAISSAIHVERM